METGVWSKALGTAFYAELVALILFFRSQGEANGLISSIPSSRPSQDWSSGQLVGSAGLALCLIPAQVEEAVVGQKLLC